MTTKTMLCVKQGLSVLQLTKMEALANAYKPTLTVYIFIFIYLFLYSVILYFIQFNLLLPSSLPSLTLCSGAGGFCDEDIMCGEELTVWLFIFIYIYLYLFISIYIYLYLFIYLFYIFI